MVLSENEDQDMSETALLPVEQKSVKFYNDEVIAVRADDGAVYVPIRPVCDNLGITLAGQRERINRDPVLSEAVTSVSVTLTQQAREMLCLPLKFIPGWLFGVNANRVKPELRENVIRYQRECFDVLAEAFMEGRLTADPSFTDLLQTNTPAVQAYKVLQELTRLARSQVLLEARVGHQEFRIDDLEKRLESVEDTIGAVDRHVTPDQASQISQAVKAVAMKLSKASGRNEYGGIYGELYRRFGITSYKQLPAAKFDQAMNWLNEWRESIEGDSPF
jgi:hypothetical protein